MTAPVDLDHMTARQFLEWQPADDRWIYELDEGSVVMSPSTYKWHNKVILYVASELDRLVRNAELGEVGIELDAMIDPQKETVRRPDIFFVARERISQVLKKHLVASPDLIVEVTSEATRHVDLQRKREQYEASPAVREYWVLDILCEPMVAYLWHRSGQKFTGGKVKGATLKSRVLKGFELDLKTVWARASEGREC